MSALAAPLRITRRSYDSFALLLLGLFVAVLLLGTLTFGVMPALVLSLPPFILLLALERPREGVRELSFYLTIPVILSAAQNVYLGLLAPDLAKDQVQTLLIVNFLLAGVFCAVLTTSPGTNAVRSRAGFVLVCTVGYAIVSFGMFGGSVQTALASMRNVVNPAMFFFIGVAAAPSVALNRLLTYIAWIAAIVVGFGFYEILIDPHVWTGLHVSELWAEKGLPINPVTEMPANFYSSESIGGTIVRRMTSTFADPVNLGTFLFFAFMAAWYLRWRVFVVVIVVAMALTVSKGALLGLLIFAVVRSRSVVTLIAAVVVGAAFIDYSLANSTQSLFAHVDGLTAAFRGLPSHPFGTGLGSVGVLANLQTQAGLNGITESGLGLIVGQLGVIGLGLFLWLCHAIWDSVKRIETRRERVLATTLLWAIMLNIAFNEVALSPNSSAAYFMTLGVLAAVGASHAAARRSDG